MDYNSEKALAPKTPKTPKTRKTPKTSAGGGGSREIERRTPVTAVSNASTPPPCAAKVKESHHLVHLLPQLEFGIGPEEFTPSATRRFCGVSAAPARFGRNSLLDKQRRLTYTMCVNHKTAKLRLT